MQPLRLDLDLDDVNLILEALGDLPFQRVHVLIGTIQQQAHAQLDEGGPAPREDPTDD